MKFKYSLKIYDDKDRLITIYYFDDADEALSRYEKILRERHASKWRMEFIEEVIKLYTKE